MPSSTASRAPGISTLAEMPTMIRAEAKPASRQNQQTGYVDRYGRGRSVCHRLPPIWKLLLTLGAMMFSVSLPIRYWHVQGVLLSLVFAAHAIAHIPLSYVVRRLAVFLPMVFLLSISLPVSQGFAAGWELMAAIFVRSTVAFACGLWLVNVMPFDQLLATLYRLWVPAILVAMLAFMYRYIFVMWDELQTMRIARRARTFDSGGLLRKWTSAAQLVGMLLIRAAQRAERVHGAMCARGWDGHVRTLDSLPTKDPV